MKWQDYWKEIKAHLPHLSEDRLSLIATIANPKSSIKGLLPERVSEDENIEEPGNKKFTLNFKHFSEKKCDFSTANETKTTVIFSKLKRVSETLLRNVSSLNFQGSIEKNSKNHDYEYMFADIDDDVLQIHELPFCGDGRIFCFYDASANFFIVAIKTKHINLHYE